MNGPCRHCPPKIHCCYYSNDEDGIIFLGVKEAEKIQKGAGKNFKEFLNFSRLTKKAIKQESENSYGFLSRQKLIDKRLLRMKLKGGKCIFFNKTRGCVIYPFRPNICRIFPFWYEVKKNNKIKINQCDYSRCLILKKIKNKKTPIKRKELLALKKLAAAMEKNERHYIKTIKKFAHDNKLFE